jgi:hypothetical protein
MDVRLLTNATKIAANHEVMPSTCFGNPQDKPLAWNTFCTLAYMVYTFHMRYRNEFGMT